MESTGARRSEDSSLARLLGIEPATIELVSDVICPWCYIGKRRLEKALALMGRDNVEILWKPFQLNPAAPKQGMERRTYRTLKFGSLATAEQLDEIVREAGRAEGIEFRFDRIEVVPNTLDAHRLIWLAEKDGNQGELVENLFRAYFTEGLNVGDPRVLRRIAIESRMAPRHVDELLASDKGAAEVRAEEQLAHRRGVHSVPCFVFEGRPLLCGAQKPELIAEALRPAIGAGFGSALP